VQGALAALWDWFFKEPVLSDGNAANPTAQGEAVKESQRSQRLLLLIIVHHSFATAKVSQLMGKH
jgi:hypothetical protein